MGATSREREPEPHVQPKVCLPSLSAQKVPGAWRASLHMAQKTGQGAVESGRFPRHPRAQESKGQIARESPGGISPVGVASLCPPKPQGSKRIALSRDIYDHLSQQPQ